MWRLLTAARPSTPSSPPPLVFPLAPQLTGFLAFDIFYYVTAGYAGLVVIHAVITTRDGYCVSLSNQAGAALRRWRRDPRGCCGKGWTPLIWVLERVGASSARPVPQEYLAPYPMKVWAGEAVGFTGAARCESCAVPPVAARVPKSRSSHQSRTLCRRAGTTSWRMPSSGCSSWAPSSPSTGSAS